MSEIKKEKKSHYISGAESRRIAKENAKATRYYEKQKKRKSFKDVLQRRQGMCAVCLEDICCPLYQSR